GVRADLATNPDGQFVIVAVGARAVAFAVQAPVLGGGEVPGVHTMRRREIILAGHAGARNPSAPGPDIRGRNLREEILVLEEPDVFQRSDFGTRRQNLPEHASDVL